MNGLHYISDFFLINFKLFKNNIKILVFVIFRFHYFLYLFDNPECAEIRNCFSAKKKKEICFAKTNEV